jgi:hypothetical protein
VRSSADFTDADTPSAPPRWSESTVARPLLAGIVPRGSNVATEESRVLKPRHLSIAPRLPLVQEHSKENCAQPENAKHPGSAEESASHKEAENALECLEPSSNWAMQERPSTPSTDSGTPSPLAPSRTRSPGIASPAGSTPATLSPAPSECSPSPCLPKAPPQTDQAPDYTALLDRAEAATGAGSSYTRRVEELKLPTDAEPTEALPRLNTRLDVPAITYLPCVTEIEAGSIIDPWRGTPAVADLMAEVDALIVDQLKVSAQPQDADLVWDTIDDIPSPKSQSLELPPMPPSPTSLVCFMPVTQCKDQ